jgi:hypothetical protein
VHHSEVQGDDDGILHANAAQRLDKGEANRISANGNPTLCTSAVVPGSLPCAIPISAIPKSIQNRK